MITCQLVTVANVSYTYVVSEKTLSFEASDCFLSDVMLAFIEIVLIWIPRIVKDVVGPSTLDDFNL